MPIIEAMRIRTLLVLMAAAVLLPVVLASMIALDKIREGERKARMMPIGGKIEKAAEPAVRDAIEKERQTGMAWLGG